MSINHRNIDHSGDLTYFYMAWCAGGEKGIDIISARDEQHARTILAIRRGDAVLVTICEPASREEILEHHRAIHAEVADYKLGKQLIGGGL